MKSYTPMVLLAICLLSLHFLAMTISPIAASDMPATPQALMLLKVMQISLACIVLALCILIFVAIKLLKSRKEIYQVGLIKFFLAGSDTAALLGSVCIASNAISINGKTLLTHISLIALTIGWFWVIKEQYVRRRPFWDELKEIFSVLGIVFLLAGTLALYVADTPNKSNIFLVWSSALTLIPLTRVAARSILDHSNYWEVPAVIIGTGQNAREAYLALVGEKSLGYKIIGFASTSRKTLDQISIMDTTLPTFKFGANMYQDLNYLGNPQIIIALDDMSTLENRHFVQEISSHLKSFHVIPSIRGLPLFGTEISHFFSHEVLFLTARNNLARRSHRWIKRGFDIAISSLALFMAMPLMAYVTWRIWREDGGPVIFKQSRVGANGQPFDFLKFRSMVNNAEKILNDWRVNNAPEWQTYEANNFKLSNDPRLLSVGQWIRSYSIDELPQLINVLRGEMSLVGPRPLLRRELDKYGQNIVLYEQSKPGLTGLWQISGRSKTTFSERSDLDAWYIRNWSLWYDIAIMFKTVKVVLNKHGAY